MSLLDRVRAEAPAVALTVPIRELLAGVEDRGDGRVVVHLDQVPLGVVHLDLAPGAPAVPFAWSAGAGGFTLDLLVGGLLPVSLTDPTGLLRPAHREQDATGAFLVEDSGAVGLRADLAVRIAGTPAHPAKLRVLPLTGGSAVEDVVTLELTPEAVLFGDTGFGLRVPHGLVLDDSTTGPVGAEAFRGLRLTGAELYVPRGIPLVGGTVATFDVDLPEEGGIDAVVHVPDDPVDVVLEWHDPTARGLPDLLPTVVQVTVTLPVRGRPVAAGQGTFTLGGADPLRLRGRFARDLRESPPAMAFDLALDGADGGDLVTVRGDSTAGKVVVTAAALATALVAESELKGGPPPSQDETGPWLAELLTAATAATAFFDDEHPGTVVVDAVRLHGTTSATTRTVRLEVDYVVDVTVQRVDAGPLRIGMDGSQPMRIRYRGVRVEADLTRPGITGLAVSFRHATLDLEDPGGWRVDSPGSVLDVIGARSGRGSVWFDVDLRFTLDLGPLTVSDATVRITVVDAQARPPRITLALRGLGVALEAGLLSARGGATLTANGFAAHLDAELGAPLDIGVGAALQYSQTAAGDPAIVVDVHADLPGPIPLGPTLLGLYGLGGMVGLNRRPLLTGTDPVERQLNWDGQTTEDGGSVMLGADVQVGTLHDWGFTYSGYGKLIVTLPEPEVRVAVNVGFLQPRVTGRDGPIKGVLVVDGEGITLGARGELNLRPLAELQIPVGGRLPFDRPEGWYLDVGTDGHPDRRPGPITAKVLPGILDLGGSAYLMAHGDGLPHLGNTDPDLSLPGPALGFGAQAAFTLGIPSVCWVAVGMTLRAGASVNPVILAVDGRLEGALHLGPFSLGAHADLKLRVGPGAAFKASFTICGSIDLWFTELEGCVSIELPPGDDSLPEVPEPAEWPEPQLVLSDRDYRLVGTPEVLPDVLPILRFPHGPAAGGTTTAFTVTGQGNAGDGYTGNDRLHYVTTLESLALTAEDGTVISGDAAWQQPVTALDVGSATPRGARELALLTYRTDHWAVRRTGPKPTPGHPDPIKGVQDGCRDSAVPTAGWALGSGTAFTDGIARLPADPWRPGRFPSVFTAALELEPYTFSDGRTDHALPLTEIGVAWLLGPVGFLGLRAAPVDPPPDVPDTGHPAFAGVLWLPCFTRLELGPDLPFAEFRWLAASLTPSDALAEATLWVVTDGEMRVANRAHDEETTTTDGARVLGFDLGAVDGPVRLQWTIGSRVGVLGLRGTTEDAVAGAAAVERFAAATQATIVHKLGVKPTDRTPVPLRPGTRYRIDAGIRIVGTLDGRTKDFGKRLATSTFTTAARLDPDLVARYVSGYTPVDRTVGWYPDDEVSAHFAHDHVPALVTAYGLAVGLALHRTDDLPRKDDEPERPGWRALPHEFTELIDPAVLPPPFRRYLTEPAGCAVPRAGVSMRARADLETRATYELAVSLGSGIRLPGVSFTTSRYANPAAQLADLGFPGRMTGHVPIDPAVLPTESGTSDAALARVLETGLRWPGVEREEHAWPPVGETGRSTALWAVTGELTGVVAILLESPEPLFRGDRLQLTELVGFPVAVRDRAGCRVLYCAPAPLPGPRTVSLRRTENTAAQPDLLCALPKGWR